MTAKYLKKNFPNLKIGGPAFCSSWRDNFKRNFLKAVKERDIPLDFYSYHCYANAPIGVCNAVLEGERALSEYGLEDTLRYLVNGITLKAGRARIGGIRLSGKRALKALRLLPGV